MEPSAQSPFQRFARRRALKRVSGRLWTSTDPFDFDDNEPPDYYRVYFEDQDGEPHARVMKVKGNSLELRLWEKDKESFTEEVEVDLDTLAAMALRIRRKYFEIAVIYASEAEFLAMDWWYPFVGRLRERLLQGTYHAITPIRAERLSVLAAVLDKRLNDNDYEYILENDSVNSEQIMVKMFGQRVLRHRDGGRINSRIDLILKSLVESGDIEPVDEHSFRPRGQAITTISQAATDDRRHRAITWLTAALVIVGLLSVDWGRLVGWAENCFVRPVEREGTDRDAD